MIQTKLDALSRYEPLNRRFPAAFQALKALAAAPFQPGVHAVDGDEIYINALEYDTASAQDSLMEAHRRYIDVMLLLEGEETIGVCNVSTLQHITTEYDPSGDALLARLEQPYTELSMHPGDIAILFPEDAHAPGMNCGEKHHVRKLIAKVRCQ